MGLVDMEPLAYRVFKYSLFSTLQQRSKWQFEKDNVNIGTLVLIKEDYLITNKYLFGRITNAYQGADGKVRVVEIRTARWIIKRGLSKIVLLPQQISLT